MGREKVKSEGGSGGKRGHFNMVHWAETEKIKASARKQRRLDDVDEVQRGLLDTVENDDSQSSDC